MNQRSLRALLIVSFCVGLAACNAPPGGGGDGGVSGSCNSNMDCGGGTPICATDGTRTFCVQCVENLDCPSGQTCDGTRGVCGGGGGGGCMSDADCGGGTPICATDGTSNFCVQCLEDVDCGGGSCDLTTGRCR